MRVRRTLIASLALILIVTSVLVYTTTRTRPAATTPTVTIVTGTKLPPAPSSTPTAPLPITPTAPTTTAALIVPTVSPSSLPASATPTPGIIRPSPPATASPPVTASPPPTLPAANLMAQVQTIRTRDLPQPSSVTLLVLGGAEAHLDDARTEYPASTVKLPIYLTLAHRIRTGEAGVTWETAITIQPADIVGGTGILQNAPGSTHTIREIAQLMIVESDNVAANLLLGRLGGAQDTRRDHLIAGAMVVDDYLTALGIHGMTLRHGLQDTQAFAAGTLSTTTSAALADLLLRTARDQATLDGAADVLALLGERGAHNPWHPMDALACGLDVQRIGGIYPASADRPGVRLDALLVATPGSEVRYILAVSVPTTPALERTVETQIARFEGDVEFALTGHWAQCVDNTTRQQ